MPPPTTAQADALPACGENPTDEETKKNRRPGKRQRAALRYRAALAAVVAGHVSTSGRGSAANALITPGGGFTVPTGKGGR